MIISQKPFWITRGKTVDVMYVIYTKIFHICKDFLKTPEKKSGTCLLQGNNGPYIEILFS